MKSAQLKGVDYPVEVKIMIGVKIALNWETAYRYEDHSIEMK